MAKIKQSKNKKTVLFVVEGETEEKFIKTFEENYKDTKQITILKNNVLQNKISQKYTKGKSYSKVYFVVDFDILINNRNRLIPYINKFKDNIDRLSAKEKYICIQYENFEDELRYCLSWSKNDLFKTFCNENSPTEFKNRFCSDNENTIQSKLKDFNFYKKYTRHQSYSNEDIIDQIIVPKVSLAIGKDIFKNNKLKT